MKRAAAKNTIDMLQKVESIEKEVTDLKLSILKNLTPIGKRVISLKGIIKGMDITDQDTNSAQVKS
jgi:hypothetical protein